MSNMHYFSNKFYFQKSPSAGDFPFSAPLNLQYWWPEVPWFGKIVVFACTSRKYRSTWVFEADYVKIELQNIVMTLFSDVMAITSPRNVTKITSHIFF